VTTLRPAALAREDLLARYREVRGVTEQLCEPLQAEDCVVQSMPAASPVKWHLGHTSWFFETFVLRRAVPGFEPTDERYAYIFNSYYRAAGDRYPQPQRGLLSRPTLDETYRYRREVDRGMEGFFSSAPSSRFAEHAFTIELGLHHEQQHQELILTDVKHLFAQNPLEPSYRTEEPAPAASRTPPSSWIGHAPDSPEVGWSAAQFAFDNERPRHRVHVDPFEICSRPVSCAHYLRFMENGGYSRPELWLSDGWDVREREGWNAPLYWQPDGEGWTLATLLGRRPVDPGEPVCHVSYYEADAFARWAGARLPLEDEWEIAASAQEVSGNFLESGKLHPAADSTSDRKSVLQMFGDVWEWTASAYRPYPGYAPFPGALSEYNGKFMSGRMVLRGGSCVTPASHMRPTYRNFFPPEARWQFSGIRLARWPASR
jgi:ergothioneine biosynthesis protein EgtB